MKLEDLNIGDSVTIFYRGQVDRIEKIERKTKTMFVTNSQGRYNINTGCAIPHEFMSGHIKPTTQEDIKHIKRRKMIDTLMGFSFFKLNYEQLENVMKIINDKEMNK